MINCMHDTTHFGSINYLFITTRFDFKDNINLIFRHICNTPYAYIQHTTLIIY